jgi:hypothetical protein
MRITKNKLYLTVLLISVAILPQVSLSGQEIDAACMAELRKADDGTCGAAHEAETKICMQQSLSKSCAEQYQLFRTKEPDAACKLEIKQVAKPCYQSSSAKFQKCFSSRTSPRCQEQLKSAAEQSQKCAKIYQDAVKKCISSNAAANTQEKQLKCFAGEVKRVGGFCAEKGKAIEAPRNGS